MDQVKFLKERVERKFGSAIKDAATLKLLLIHINKSSDLDLSYNTLRRFFGFLAPTKPNINTLNGLSQYVGFRNFYSFSNQHNFPNWEPWLYVLRLKQQEKISEEDIQFFNSQVNNQNFVFYFIDVATHFINQKNEAVCLKLFEIKFDTLVKSEQLRVSLALGILLRHSYGKDTSFISALLQSPPFRRMVVYNFIDYSNFNFGYMELIHQSIQLEKEGDHLLFLHLLSSYHGFLNGHPKKALRLSAYFNLKEAHPIVQGRYYAYLLYSSPESKRKAIFKQLITQSKFYDKNQIFFEIIPTLILLRRTDLIALIYDRYYEEIFDIDGFNQLTHLWIYQIGQVFLSIKEGHHERAAGELEKVNIDLALDSYIDYIKLFSLIARYYLEEDKAGIKQQYTNLASKLGFTVFSLDLLECYFE